MFSIGFTHEPLEYPYDDTSIPAAPGRLVLGESTEDFLANLSLWGKSDYESHWIRELKALYNGSPKVALIVSYDDPRAATNMELWRVYRDGEFVRFQNQLLPYSNLPHEFDVTEISQSIQDWIVVTAEGNRISEWHVALRDVELFLGRSNAP
jgi:carotenoid cleavage dioxygenase-like enzyme